jgi:hypothetical protein
MKRLTVGGSLRFLAVCEAKRLSIPSASKPPSFLYSVLCEIPTSSALSATETSKSTNGRISS